MNTKKELQEKIKNIKQGIYDKTISFHFTIDGDLDLIDRLITMIDEGEYE